MRRFLSLVLMAVACCSLAVAQDILPVRRRIEAAAAAGSGGGPLVFDATSKTSSAVATGSLSVTITNNSGADRTMWIVGAYDANATGASATVDGNAASELIDQYHPDFGNLFAICGYSFVNQAAGVNTVVLTFAGTNPDTSALGVICFTNGDTNSPVRTAATAFASSGTTASVTAAGAVTGDIVVDIMYGAVTTGITVGANQTSRVEYDAIGGAAISVGASTQNGVDGGVMTWTMASGIWQIGAVAFKAKP